MATNRKRKETATSEDESGDSSSSDNSERDIKSTDNLVT
jgi:hypothetical protein